LKIYNTKMGGYVEGDSVLHNLKPQTKIIAALFLLMGSGIGNGWALAGVGSMSVLGVLIARVPVKEIFHVIRRMAWFFIAIAIFPVLFTPGFYIDLPAWFPVSISREGLVLGLESTARLLNILFISLVLVRTTADWMDGLDKLLGPMSQYLPIIRDLLAVSVMAVKFLPMVFTETEERFADLGKNKNERGVKKLFSMCDSLLQYIASVFSDLDRWSTENYSACGE
jgi:energy-coupling factor transport system permease protein